MFTNVYVHIYLSIHYLSCPVCSLVFGESWPQWSLLFMGFGRSRDRCNTAGVETSDDVKAGSRHSSSCHVTYRPHQWLLQENNTFASAIRLNLTMMTGHYNSFVKVYDLIWIILTKINATATGTSKAADDFLKANSLCMSVLISFKGSFRHFREITQSTIWPMLISCKGYKGTTV